MSYQVVITDTAAKDMDAIYSYIAYTLQEPATAAKMLDKMEQGILTLDEMPYRYQEYQQEPWKSRGMRQMVVGSYVIFYIPDEEKQTVDIVRVIYGGRDIPAVLLK